MLVLGVASMYAVLGGLASFAVGAALSAKRDEK